jgi:hypothetical protein
VATAARHSETPGEAGLDFCLGEGAGSHDATADPVACFGQDGISTRRKGPARTRDSRVFVREKCWVHPGP